MTTKCDLVNGPCACGSFHVPGDKTFGQAAMWPNKVPNGGDPAKIPDMKEHKYITPQQAYFGYDYKTGPNELSRPTNPSLPQEEYKLTIEVDKIEWMETRYAMLSAQMEYFVNQINQLGPTLKQLHEDIELEKVLRAKLKQKTPTSDKPD